MTAGTIFDRTRTPLTVWFTACRLFATGKIGMSALSLKRVDETFIGGEEPGLPGGRSGGEGHRPLPDGAAARRIGDLALRLPVGARRIC